MFGKDAAENGTENYVYNAFRVLTSQITVIIVLIDIWQAKQHWIQQGKVCRFVMEAKCSFSDIVGGSCTYERRDRANNTEVVPLLHCSRDREIAGHKPTWENWGRIDTSRTSIFTFPENLAQLTISPYHRSSLGIGWRRESQRCQIPRDLSNHSDERRWPKGKRGLGKLASNFVYQKTGVFVPVGSGMHR